MLLVLISMLIYGLIHSLLASREVKDAFQGRLGERVYHGFYRLIYTIIAVVTFLPIAGLVILREGDVVWSIPLEWEPVLFVVQMIGIVGFLVSVFQIDGMRFLGLRQAWAYFNGEPLPLPAEPLSTKGVYAIVRHPLYLFSLLVIWPVQTMTEAYLGFAIGATLYFIVGSYYEERRMVEVFGDQYQAYRERVPWLIPFLRFG
jgi:protein-S-isoprenylcysteine O-methyltransferase Ste14